MTTRVARRKCAGPCGKNRLLSSYVSDKGRVCAVCRKAKSRASGRRSHLLKTYGITQDEYDAILDAQGGVCAVCGGKRPYHLAVDHDHKLEADLIAMGAPKEFAARWSIRGGLCKRDNKLLRDLRDDPVLLRQLLAYLADPPARAILRTNTQLTDLFAE